ncbi:MAG: DUF1080 domain-containing protein [Phycisphaeraceae bacterium]
MTRSRFTLFTLCTLLVALASFTFAEDKKDDDKGWITLFDGKSLDGWKIAENEGAFKLEDGKIVVNGTRGHMFYVGKDGKAEFKNFEFKAMVMTEPGSNSGIFFHTKFQKDGWPVQGYEAQVNNTYKPDPKKSFSLYNVVDVKEQLAKDNEWFEYTIIVKDKHIVFKLNGKTVLDHTEAADPGHATRRLSAGTFALQAHDPKSKAYFKDIKVRPLD